MLPIDAAKSFYLAVLYHSFPGTSPGTAVEVPAAKNIGSLKSASEWLRKLGVPCIASAVVWIELSESRLTEKSEMLLIDYEHGITDFLILQLRKSVIAFAEKFVDLSIAANHDWAVETLDFKILDIEKRDDTVPGIFVEVSHGASISDDTRWCGDRLPGSVIGHITIQVYSDALLDDAKTALESLHLEGDPDKLEELVQDSVKNIIANLLI